MQYLFGPQNYLYKSINERGNTGQCLERELPYQVLMTSVARAKGL